MTADVEDLVRTLSPQVVGALTRRYGHFHLAEDATQEALLAATVQWPRDGVPDNPRGWLLAVGARRYTDLLRTELARQQREERVARMEVHQERADMEAADDSLVLLFLCCHPDLSPASRIALTLRAVGGLTTHEIARALLSSESAVTRRVTRAKHQIRDRGSRFDLPAPEERNARLAEVLHVLYLVFNEGYAATSGTDLVRVDLCSEAIRLTRMLRDQLPEDREVAGLLALMLLVDARRPARATDLGELVPMSAQDRSRWDPAMIAEGVDLVTASLSTGPAGPYAVQAAIAAVHDEAATWKETDWPQIAALYDVLLGLTDTPVIRLNRAVAVAMSEGPERGLALTEPLLADPRMATDHRLHAVRGQLFRLAGNPEEARANFETAAGLTHSAPHQRYLHDQARGVHPTQPGTVRPHPTAGGQQ